MTTEDRSLPGCCKVWGINFKKPVWIALMQLFDLCVSPGQNLVKQTINRISNCSFHFFLKLSSINWLFILFPDLAVENCCQSYPVLVLYNVLSKVSWEWILCNVFVSFIHISQNLLTALFKFIFLWSSLFWSFNFVLFNFAFNYLCILCWYVLIVTIRYVQPDGRITISAPSVHRRVNKICSSGAWTQWYKIKIEHFK